MIRVVDWRLAAELVSFNTVTSHQAISHQPSAISHQRRGFLDFPPKKDLLLSCKTTTTGRYSSVIIYKHHSMCRYSFF